MRFAEQALERPDQFVGDGIVIIAVDQHAIDFMFDQFADRAHGGHHRHAADALRFENGEGGAFPARGQQQDVGLGEGIGQGLR